ncbi:hypothetical protein CONPUDRAFT_163222 [Coniophora puteana RWD-64-598 SS2]|uniref:Uncharacterized protein n=1 Tax=Coniophora puteana (strain RWD-64-598) TaxID=741705 RepID=A0A5M3MZC2_CONPW|nr:uncharacterized protein CONPUDRAFT_163222 [Coniophora puteana RWD-64-598 SS2]EIW83971.1 hypothetical protein CONPUDRAFT_163222 [Coniophora puteana RWD-64-598 SS2]
MSAAPAHPQVQVHERQDIHKSCKTLETLVNALNDYCEVSGAMVTLQKKLAKALKEAAGMKTINEPASNALGACASIFEAVAEIDTKFSKFADKECDSLSDEVKKYFKKLSKEEKTHDERMANSNARIKSAGQSYEKKSKKNARDAAEEHARYINLISTLGPEMSQEKYNHAIHVTRQHASATYGVASSLGRIADAQWLRNCEGLRRCAPCVGSLGHWRSYCEASWAGPLPNDLPDVDSPPGQISTDRNQGLGIREWGQGEQNRLPVPSVTSNKSGASTPAESSVGHGMEPPRPPFASDDGHGSVNSIASLSAFPFPPTHFPVPLANNQAELQRRQTQLKNLQIPQPKKPGQAAYILSESPKPIESISESTTLNNGSTASSARELPTTPTTRSQNGSFSHEKAGMDGPNNAEAPTSDQPAPAQEEPPRKLGSPVSPFKRKQMVAQNGDERQETSRPSSSARAESDMKARDEVTAEEREFGVQRKSTAKAFTVAADAGRKNLERTESTTSNGSLVAAMKNRYSRSMEPASAAPKDIPRLNQSVANMATRYQPADEPTSPRKGRPFPMAEQQTPTSTGETSVRSWTRDRDAVEEELQRRKQQLAQLELQEKEFELRQRERELEQRTRALEQDRQQFFLDGRDEGIGADTPRANQSNNPRSVGPYRHRRNSQSTSVLVNSGNNSNKFPVMGSGSHSASSSQLAPPPSDQASMQSHSPTRSSQPPTPSLSPLGGPVKDHAPFCGCDLCSASKYQAANPAPSPHDLRPPEPPIQLRPEKPKGWIRRLSMPSVAGALSMDSKKNVSVSSLLPMENGRLRKRSFDQGISNRTVGQINSGR